MSPMRKVGRAPLSETSDPSAAQEGPATTEPTVAMPVTATEPAVVEVETPVAHDGAPPAGAREVEVPEAEALEIEVEVPEVEAPVAVDIAPDTEATAETSPTEANGEVDVDLADAENGEANGEGRKSGIFGRLFSRKR